jgi:Flp pilus assembly protein TadB
VSLALAAAAAVAASALYLVWPRPETPEEWVLSRRRAVTGQTQALHTSTRWILTTDVVWARRLRWAIGLARADLRLLAGGGGSPSEEQLATSLLRQAALGAGAGLLAGLATWFIGGHQTPPVSAPLLMISAALLVPAASWLSLRRRASRARAAIVRRLPRIFTGAFVLLESGAVTPERALSAVVGVHRGDPAANVLREVALQREVRHVELADALEEVGRTYEIEPLRRLADAHRIATQQGTRMADLLSEFALDLRRAQHAAFRERMTRAPVLMTVPALVFFVLPLLALVLMLVLAPLSNALGQL